MARSVTLPSSHGRTNRILMAGPYVLPLPVQAPLGLDRFETTHITGNQLVGLIVTSPLAFVLPRDSIAFVALILALLFRPHGLFGRR